MTKFSVISFITCMTGVSALRLIQPVLNLPYLPPPPELVSLHVNGSDELTKTIPDHVWKQKSLSNCTNDIRGLPKRGQLLIEGGDSMDAGFGSLFYSYPINHIILAEAYCLEPSIQMTKSGAPSFYREGLGNPWEWYFMPLEHDPKVPTDSLSTVRLNPEKVADQQTSYIQMQYRAPWAVRSYYYGVSDAGKDINQYDESWYRKNRQAGHEVVKKHYRVRPELQKLVEDFWEANVPAGTPVLAVHHRGPGKGDTQHRRKEENLIVYRPHIRQFLLDFPHGKILLCTDDIDAQHTMLHGLWGNKLASHVLVPNLIENTEEAKDMFDWSHEKPRANHTYHLQIRAMGELALKDILLMAKADFFIYGQSTMAEAVFYHNMKLHGRSIPIFDKDVAVPIKGWFKQKIEQDKHPYNPYDPQEHRNRDEVEAEINLGFPRASFHNSRPG